jgi:hypothetical protein
MKLNIRKTAAVAIFGFAFALPGRAAESDLQAAIVPDADILGQIDLEKLSASPFSKAMDKKEDPLQKEILDQLGIVSEDITRAVLSMSLKGLDEADAKVPLVFAVESRKPLDLQKISDFIVKKAGENKKPLAIQKLQVEGQPAIKIENDKGDQTTILLSLSKDGKVMLVAFDETLLAAMIKRSSNAQAAPLSKDLEALCKSTAASQMRFCCVLPESVREKLREAGKDNPEAGNNPFGGLTTAFRGLERMSWTASCNEQMQMTLSFDLGSPEDAKKGAVAIKGMVDMVSGLVTMQAVQDQKLAPVLDLFKGITIQDAEKNLSLNMVVGIELAKKLQDTIAAFEADTKTKQAAPGVGVETEEIPVELIKPAEPAKPVEPAKPAEPAKLVVPAAK